MSGAMAEYIIRSPQSVKSIMKVPDSVSDEEAALTEPLNVGLAPVYEAGIKAGDSVAILGAGHIGQLTLLAAKAAGAAPIIITDRIQSRLDKALEMGADFALNMKMVMSISALWISLKSAPMPCLSVSAGQMFSVSR